MMQIVYFSQKEQFLTEMESWEGEVVCITPSPAKADGLRSRLSSSKSVDVITIAKFTSDLLQKLWNNEDRPEIKRKSELLLIFGILKNKYLPDLGYEQFTQAYNLFSDLRSFTLSQDALTSVLDEQPEIIKLAVSLFWKLLDSTGFLDEHGAYNALAEALRGADDIEEFHKTHVFWGFQHLNGQQVDLLKALSIRYDVVIPFPKNLKDNLKKSDWISWIKDSKVSELELPPLESHPKASWFPINSREISLHLKNLLRENDQIVLGVSKLTSHHMNVIPTQNLRFKIPHELLGPELKEVTRDLKDFKGDINGLKSLLDEKIKNVPTMKHYRALQLYQEALQSITELTDEGIDTNSFFLKLLSDVVHLNQPRTSYVPISSDIMTMDLKDMSSLEDLDHSRRIIICIDDRFEEIQSMGQNYTESIQRSLSALGPLKRNELELLFKQWEFRDLFSHADVTVLMSTETLKHGLIWKKLFSGIELTEIKKDSNEAAKNLKDPFGSFEKKKFQGSFSASKLQTFLDCPRKFYFSYVERIFPSVLLEKDFDPMTSGTVIHEIIERYFKENIDKGDLKTLTSQVMQIYIQKNGLILSPEVYSQRNLIFFHRALNGIEFIHELEDKVKEKISWEIESGFELHDGIDLKGRIDCLGISDKFIFLLDFKSTEGAASSASEVASYESVQLWTYVHAAKSAVKDWEKKTIVMGYVVLDDPSSSSLLSSDEEFIKLIKDAKLCKTHKFKEDFSIKSKEALDIMTDLSSQILLETRFSARPRKSSSCNYCELNKVCVKSELEHV